MNKSVNTRKKEGSTRPAVSGIPTWFWGIAAIACCFFGALPTWADSYWTGELDLVSRTTGNTKGNDDSGRYSNPVISADGRYIAYCSSASNLVSGDTNGYDDIFTYDRQTATVERVSIATGGDQANEDSFGPAISADGRFVSFASFANNLVAADTNATVDVFVHDRDTGVTERVSLADNGDEGFMSSGNAASTAISATGRYVAFEADASNLVNHEDLNTHTDIFVRDLEAGSTELVSVTSSGLQMQGTCKDPSISANGRYIAFLAVSHLAAEDTNDYIDDVFVHDRQEGTTTLVSYNVDGSVIDSGASRPTISANGRYIVYSRDTDIFLYDLQTQTTEKVNVRSNGAEVLGWSNAPTISGDGRFVVFQSTQDDLVGVPNIYISILIKDRETGHTYWVSRGANGSPPSGYTDRPVISTDGSSIAFVSEAENLVSSDTDDVYDVYVSSTVEFRESRMIKMLPAILNVLIGDR